MMAVRHLAVLGECSWVGLYDDIKNVVLKKIEYLSNLKQQTYLL